MYEKFAKPIVSKVLEGYNGTILAYGQTSSGKTHTMIGDDNKPGIIYLAVKDIFKKINESSDREFLVRIGSVEIYNDKIYDLLDNGKSGLSLLESNGNVVINQKEITAKSEEEVIKYFKSGNSKQVAGTKINDRSSRSHSIFRVTVEAQNSKDGKEAFVSNLFLVDLAGSEKPDSTKASFNEGLHINKSLLVLGRIIRELAKKAANVKHINYRECKLTRILSPALGGNSYTAVICTVSPTALEETYQTIFFAQNAKKSKTYPKLNTIKLSMKKASSQESVSGSSLNVATFSRRRKIMTPVGSQIDLVAPFKKTRHELPDITNHFGFHHKMSHLLSVQVSNGSLWDSQLVLRPSKAKQKSDSDSVEDEISVQENSSISESFANHHRTEKENSINEKHELVGLTEERLENQLKETQKALDKSRNLYSSMLAAKHDAIDTIRRNHDEELNALNQKNDSLQIDVKLFEKAFLDKETDIKKMEKRAYAAEDGVIEMKRNFDVKLLECQQEYKKNLKEKTKRIEELEIEIFNLKKQEKEKDLRNYIQLEKHLNLRLVEARKNFEEMMQQSFDKKLTSKEIYFDELLSKKDEEIMKLRNELIMLESKSSPLSQNMIPDQVKELQSSLKKSLEKLKKTKLSDVHQLLEIMSSLQNLVNNLDNFVFKPNAADSSTSDIPSQNFKSNKTFIATSTPVGGFNCSYCNKVFSRKISLDRHVTQAHKQFSCNFCRKNFKSSNFLKIHKNTCHREYM